MLRILKRLVGIWEPKEGVLYTNKNVGYERKLKRSVNIITECFVNGTWQRCSFMLKKGKYYVSMGKKRFVIEKKYVEVKKVKKEEGVADVWFSNDIHYGVPVLDIHYRLTVKDPSKIVYVKE